MALPIFTDKYQSVGPAINTSRWLKYVFLSFAQSVFNQYDEFKWVPDRAASKLIIQDKYAANNTNIEKIPQLIFNRGSFQLMRVTTDGVQTQETVNILERQKQSTLMRCTSSFSCIASDPTTSEHLADLLFLAIYSYRELFKPKGIRFIHSLDIGECNPVEVEQGGSKIEAFNTPVYISFDYQLLYEKNVNYGGRTFVIPDALTSNIFSVNDGIGSGSGAAYAPEVQFEYYSSSNDYLVEIGEPSGPVPVVYIPDLGYVTYRNPDNPSLSNTFDLIISGYPGETDSTLVARL